MVAPGAMRRPREDQARLVNAPDASGSRGDNRSFSSSGLERAELADFCSAPPLPATANGGARARRIEVARASLAPTPGAMGFQSFLKGFLWLNNMILLMLGASVALYAAVLLAIFERERRKSGATRPPPRRPRRRSRRGATRRRTSITSSRTNHGARTRPDDPGNRRPAPPVPAKTRPKCGQSRQRPIPAENS